MSASMGQDGGAIRGLNSTSSSSSSRHAAGLSQAVDQARQAVQERAQGAGASYRQISQIIGQPLDSDKLRKTRLGTEKMFSYKGFENDEGEAVSDGDEDDDVLMRRIVSDTGDIKINTKVSIAWSVRIFLRLLVFVMSVFMECDTAVLCLCVMSVYFKTLSNDLFSIVFFSYPRFRKAC